MPPQLQATPLQQPSGAACVACRGTLSRAFRTLLNWPPQTYFLFGGTSGLLSHAVNSTLPISSNMATPTSAPLPSQSSASGVGGHIGGGQDMTTMGTKKSDSWQAQAQTTKVNEPEVPHDDSEEGKGVKKTEKRSRRQWCTWIRIIQTPPSSFEVSTRAQWTW